jgi:hypothetical protein
LEKRTIFLRKLLFFITFAGSHTFLKEDFYFSKFYFTIINYFPVYMSKVPETAYNFKEGEVLLFDKPLNWTSFDLVRKIRAAIKGI